MPFTASLFVVINAADIIFVDAYEVENVHFAENGIEMTLSDGKYTKVVFAEQNVTGDDAGQFTLTDKAGVVRKVGVCAIKPLVEADLPK